MSTYVKVQDVIETIRRFHRQIREFYARLARKSDKKRVKLILDYMSRRELSVQEGLEKYDDEGVERLLDSRLQYGPDEEQLELPPIEVFRPDMSIEDVERIALQFADALTAFCASAARLAKPEAVRRLFEALAEQQEADKATIAKVHAVARDA